MDDSKFKYKVMLRSRNRDAHEEKKRWLDTQGAPFGTYLLKAVNEQPLLSGLNFYWCFDNPEIATIFKLKWKNDT